MCLHSLRVLSGDVRLLHKGTSVAIASQQSHIPVRAGLLELALQRRYNLSPLILEVDESDPGDIKVWGDFRVYNYVQSGDTLKTVSGGSHPGLLHLKEVDGKFEVTDFNAVADGADNIPSAERIFKDKFDAFQKMVSDEADREEVRNRAIAAYALKHDLDVTVYQDFGWDPEEIIFD